MRQVCAPANVAEAQMLVHMLGEHDILAHIHGEALQGGVGELPAGGLLQVAVADEDYDAARRLIEAWEKTDAPSPTPKPALPFVTGLLVFALGLFGGWGLHVAATRNAIPIDVSVERLDLNGDGQIDQTYHFRIAAPWAHKGETDQNFDGVFDLTQRFDEAGTIVSADADNNFDSFVESQTEYRAGLATRTHIDTNRDGVIDRKIYYRNNVVSREEIHDPDTQLLLRIDYYNNLRLDRVEIDLDRDGFLETVRTIDPIGEVTATETRARP